MSLTAPEQPVPGQDPAVTPDPTSGAAPAAPIPVPPTTAPSPADATQGTAPWAADLNAVFTDETQRGQVDQFLREKIQPYTTQLEQQAAQSKDAQRLWENLNADPIQTYVQITEELYGPEAAQAVLGSLQQTLETAQTEPQADAQPGQAALDPRLESVIQYVENQQTRTYYDSQIERIATDPQYADVDTNLRAFHGFVAAADGDFEQAVSLYRDAAAGFAAKSAPPAEETPPAETPPNVMGSDTATVGTPPVEPPKQTLNEAIEDFVRENRPNPAPPVGTA